MSCSMFWRFVLGSRLTVVGQSLSLDGRTKCECKRSLHPLNWLVKASC